MPTTKCVAIYDVSLTSTPRVREHGRAGEKFQTIVEFDVPSEDVEFAKKMEEPIRESFVGLPYLTCTSVTFGSFQYRQNDDDNDIDRSTFVYTNGGADKGAD